MAFAMMVIRADPQNHTGDNDGDGKTAGGSAPQHQEGSGSGET
jgi:hypothetical protein